jgi:hypothetical protein
LRYEADITLPAGMKPGNPLKHFVFAFVIALLFYVIAYTAIEYQRTRKGPWRVTFTNAPAARPAMIIEQPTLAISNLQIVFTAQTNASNRSAQTIVFAQPRPVPYEVPFGECIFMDTTFLPGTVTFRLYGHEIELLPRVLIIDHEEHRWVSNEIIPLSASPGETGPRDGKVR